MSLTMRDEGRRIYVAGNTYAVRDSLRSAGCHWDAQRKEWWIGASQREKIASLVADPLPVSAEAAQDRLMRDRENILGTAKYKGHSYFVVWHGTTVRGNAYRLMFMDGSQTFFADAELVQDGKIFRRPVSLDLLQQPRAESDGDEKECWACKQAQRRGYYKRHLYDGCDVCGAEEC